MHSSSQGIMKVTSCILAALATLSSVTAHSTFQEFEVGTKDYAGTCIRTPLNNNPVSSVTGSDIACNTKAGTSAGYCDVVAGGNATVEMHAQPGDRSCTNIAIGGNHDGPVIVYMAKVDNALTASATSAKWFKVAESGLVGKDRWATDVLNDNCGKFTFTVPACIPPGDYLVRAEVIALHVAGQLNGAQFYMSCYTVKVSGTGNTLPASTVSFPGAYTAKDPGILFDLYGSYSTYVIPGPPVWNCAAGGTTLPVATATDTATLPPVSTIPVSSTEVATTPTGPLASLYGQCGGENWTGPTFCSQGTCTASNQYYSQCLP